MITQTGDIRDDVQREEAGTRPIEDLAPMHEERHPCVWSHRGIHRIFSGGVRDGDRAMGKDYQGLLEADERFMGRWYKKEEEGNRLNHAWEAITRGGVQGKGEGGRG